MSKGTNGAANATATAPVALITGAASGMGLALTHHLVSKGYKVGMCDINGPLGSKEAAGINSAHPHSPSNNGDINSSSDRVLFRQVNITNYAAQASFFRDVFEWGGGRIDYFAANAGITDKDSLFKRAERMEVDKSTGLPRQLDQSAIDVDVKAVVDGVWLYRFFAARRRDGRKGGKITVTASVAGLYPFKGLPLYGTSKHAVVGLVRCAAPGLRREGIVINAVCPSFVRTGLLPQAMLDMWPAEHLTPMETVLRAHDGFLEGEDTGQTVETSQDQLFWRKPVEYANESARWIAEDSDEYWMKLKRILPSKM